MSLIFQINVSAFILIYTCIMFPIILLTTRPVWRLQQPDGLKLWRPAVPRQCEADQCPVVPQPGRQELPGLQAAVWQGEPVPEGLVQEHARGGQLCHL